MSLSVVTFAAGGNGGSSASSVSASAFNCVAGNTLLVHLRPNNTSAITGVSDTAGNVFVPVGALYTPVSPSGGDGQFFICNNCLGNAANVVVGAYTTSASYSGIMVWQISGGFLTFDNQFSNSLASPDTSYPAATLNTNYDNEIAVVAFYENALAIIVGDSPLTNDGNAASYVGDGSHIIYTSKQTGVTLTGTGSINTGAIYAACFGIAPLSGASGIIPTFWMS